MLIDGINAEWRVGWRPIAAVLLDEITLVQVRVRQIVVRLGWVIGGHRVAGVVRRVGGVFPGPVGPALDPAVARIKRFEVAVTPVIIRVLCVVLDFVENHAIIARADAVADHGRVDADAAVARRPPVCDAGPAFAILHLYVQIIATAVDVRLVIGAPDVAVAENGLPRFLHCIGDVLGLGLVQNPVLILLSVDVIDRRVRDVPYRNRARISPHRETATITLVQGHRARHRGTAPCAWGRGCQGILRLGDVCTDGLGHNWRSHLLCVL